MSFVRDMCQTLRSPSFSSGSSSSDARRCVRRLAMSAFAVVVAWPTIVAGQQPAGTPGPGVPAARIVRGGVEQPAPVPTVPQPTAPVSQPSRPMRVLTLDDALALAEGKSEQVAIAAAGVSRAIGNEQRVKSERFPQVFGSASYDRALKSEFEGLFDTTTTGPPACDASLLNPSAPLDQRVLALEQQFGCQPSGGIFDGDDDGGELPFGRANTYRLGFTVDQLVYSGGRLGAQERQARLARNNADLNVTSTQAQFTFDVAQAFYDAALSDRVVMIAEENYAQADRTFGQVRAQREAGRLSEFEQLRAQVDRDTLLPEIVRARNQRDVAYLRLKQLVDLPLDEPLQAVVELEGDVLPAPQRLAPALAEAEAKFPVRERTAVLQQVNEVQSSEADITVARSQRFPTVSVYSIYGLVSYPEVVPGFDDWRTNWTVGAGLSIPIFTGRRIKAEEAMARAGLEESQQTLRLIQELARLDAENARVDVIAARAQWEASAGTIGQATRAYEIAELRYREGLSTQLELSDSRLLLVQARFNRARAARDLQVARARFALLPELPLLTGAGAAVQAQAEQAAQARAVQAVTTQQPAGGVTSTGATGTGAGTGTSGGRGQ
jgi:outer membrane protein TolC